MSVQRRTVIKGGAVAGAAIAGGPFQGLLAAPASARRKGSSRRLRPVPDLRDGQVRLHLPEGFSYRSFHDTETEVVLNDGTVLPGRHDGMGAFRRGDNVVLVRNHEVNGPGAFFGPAEPYDEMARGGCTTVEVTKKGKVVSAKTSLNGTMMNCSGGIMPWGSWVTCEETVNGPDVGPDFTRTSNVPLKKPHGYIFEVPANGESTGRPITRAGRFAHEAVSFDPDEGHLYLTEDNFAYPSGFYRYKPKTDPNVLTGLDNDGTLQMLAVKGRRNAHLEGKQHEDAVYDVEWVDIDDPDPEFEYTEGQEAPTSNDTALTYVGDQGRALGAAGFSRLEGQVYDDGVVYFCSTQGGGRPEKGPDSVGGYGNGSGQVWGYRVSDQTLHLVYQSPNRNVLDFPDNVTTSRNGTLVLCEDNSNDNYVRGLAENGKIFDIALNRLTSSAGADRSGDEFAGSTFSTDGHTLFVNIQASNGMTFAIWGPWERIGV